MKTSEIAELIGGTLSGDSDIEIIGVADIATATSGELAFASSNVETLASCVIVPIDFSGDLAGATIRVRDPRLAFAIAAEALHPFIRRAANVNFATNISPSATIGAQVFIDAFVSIGDNSTIGDCTQIYSGTRIGDGVTIGSNCIFRPNVVIENGCEVGDNVTLHAGVVIGTDGFGFARDKDRYVKFPQIGTVVIESNVEIGANSCIDRGALGETRIGEGTKIDNLVQIAHNASIGKRVVIAAQTGISGSTVIEDDCVIGGQVGMGDHARVLSGAVIGSQAGILPGKIVRAGVWWGTPVQPLDEYKKQNAHLKGIARLKAEVKRLRELIEPKK